MDWKIYYGDGSTFSSDDGDYYEAPAWNVQTIVQPHIESGRYLLPPYDFYIWRHGRWEGVDEAGMADFLVRLGILRLGKNYRKEILRDDKWYKIDDIDLVLNVADMGLAIIGRTIRKKNYQFIIQMAQSDPDFPVRTAYRKEDWRPELDQSR